VEYPLFLAYIGFKRSPGGITAVNGNDRQKTIFDIAEALDISPSTVSRALNDSPLVKEKTKIRILKEAEKLNYIPNLAAKNLAKGQSDTVGLLLSDMSIVNSIFASLFSKDIHKSGYRSIVFNSDGSPESQDYYLKELAARRVSAIVISPIPGEYAGIKYALKAKVPVVVINRFVQNPELNHVLFDLRRGICAAVDTLVEERDKKHFYYLAPKDIFEGIERRKVFEFALKAHGLMPAQRPVYPAEDDPESGYKAMNKILDTHEKVDAVICSSDQTALGVIRALHDRKKRVPQDVAVVGFFNTPLSEYSSPRISSIDVNMRDYVRKVVARVVELGKNRMSKPVNISISTRFISKETG
jgi:LacI family transcriptional regulator